MQDRRIVPLCGEAVEIIYTTTLSAKKEPEREALRSQGFFKAHDVLFLAVNGSTTDSADFSSFVLRIAEAQDLPAVQMLQASCFDPLSDALPDQHQLAEEITCGNVLVIHKKNEREILGTAMMERNRSRLFIRHVAVSPAHRRQGIGTAIMVGMLRTLRPGEKCVLWVKEDNREALKLYEHLGFTVQNRRMEIWEKR